MTNGPLLEAQHISRNTANGLPLLRDVSLSVSAGERWAIVGPTGAGKTVFLRTLAMLDPHDDGVILWQGKEVANDDIPAYRRQIVYLHQQPVLFEGTVETNIRLPEIFGQDAHYTYDEAHVLALLADLGRDRSFLAKSSDVLSGGEAQIVALLRAIEIGPSILLLDEPTASLDGESSSAFEMLVGRWLNEPGCQRATVWVTHNTAQITRVADQTLSLKMGHVEEAAHAG